MIHVAVMHLTEPDPDGETELVFVSLDGEDYLPVTRPPQPGDEAQIAALFEGDGNFKPIRFARRAMSADWWRGNTAASFDHYTVNG